MFQLLWNLVRDFGEMSFVLDGEVISTVDIIAKNSVDKINLFTMSKKIYYSWIDLLRS